ncbi:6531_t:CDS:2 [Paraglomus occultum]|uniref:6531_t:CDS:1 n=1 Tax=Paraglomus occultum TaxID=144539 RepID=A0A9N9A3V5_9GLOM|nr:6531_t:CDS:2 [Paraglomus occultum]
MTRVTRLRRREPHGDVHSEDEEDTTIAQGLLVLSDISQSSDEDDADSELTQSEGEEETSERISEHSPEKSGHESPKDVGEETHAEVNIDGCYLLHIEEAGTEDIHSEKDVQKEMEITDNDLSRTPTAWEKKVQARQEYRKKLAEDPAFVPHLGEFWGHDDRFMDDGLKNDSFRRRSQLPFASKGKGGWNYVDGPSPAEKWGHDGFEELMRMEAEEVKKYPPINRGRNQFPRPPPHGPFGNRRSLPPQFESTRHFSHKSQEFRRQPPRPSDSVCSNHMQPTPKSVESTFNGRSPGMHNHNRGQPRSFANNNRPKFVSEPRIHPQPPNNYNARRNPANVNQKFKKHQDYVRRPINFDRQKLQNNGDLNSDVKRVPVGREDTVVIGKAEIEDKAADEKDNNSIDNQDEKDFYRTEKANDDSKASKPEPSVNTETTKDVEPVTTDRTTVQPPSENDTVEDNEEDDLLQSQESSDIEIILELPKSPNNALQDRINDYVQRLQDSTHGSQAPSSDLSDKDAECEGNSHKTPTVRVTLPVTGELVEVPIAKHEDTQAKIETKGSIPASAIFAKPFQPRSLATQSEPLAESEYSADTENTTEVYDSNDGNDSYTPDHPNYQGPSYEHHPITYPQDGTVPMPYYTDPNGTVYYYDPNVYYYFPSYPPPYAPGTSNPSTNQYVQTGYANGHYDGNGYM